ncbi:MAG TPA: glycoside hydrolase family 3 C-terminal domain-containing protein, partial [Gemmatimonadales bacterium]|nr:glycoside hydrolase family 3 C-terminal domain-containing protein [Gemmatimonadales bacterium]
IRAVAATGTPVVVVIVGGAPVTMSEWIDSVGAVLMAWYPGEAGGDALADIIFGAQDPGGRLPVTFPLDEGQLPLYYNHKPTGRGDDYLDLAGRPLFPFGFGKSYTSFEYSGMTLSTDTIGIGESVSVSFQVRNTGMRRGVAVPQLYLRDRLASIAQPVMMLRKSARMELEPGEERVVEWILSPEDLSLLDIGMERVVEPGSFRIMVGESSRDIRTAGDLHVAERD